MTATRPAAPQADIGEMPDEPIQALRFRKARTARSAALLEDYVELIADLHAAHGEARASEIAKRLGVTHPTALKSIGRLRREGLATARPYRGIFLTEAGVALANRVRARHRLMVELLRAVGVPADVAEADAEGMEHYASEASLQAFARFLAGAAGPSATGHAAGPDRTPPSPQPQRVQADDDDRGDVRQGSRSGRARPAASRGTVP